MYIFFGVMSTQIPLFLIRLVIFLLLSFKISLHILDTSLLSDVFFASVFSQTMTCLFILLALSLAKQKFLILMKSSLSFISFMVHLLWYFKTYCYTQFHVDIFSNVIY